MTAAHTHEIKIKSSTTFTITYGDHKSVTLIRWCFGKEPSLKRIDQAIRRIVRRHDRQALKAESLRTRVANIQQEYNDHFLQDNPEKRNNYSYSSPTRIPRTEWGSEVLIERD